MKKSNSKVLAALMVLLLAVLLTACKGTTITTTSNGATFEFNKLTEDDINETTALFHFDDAILKVSLERGTADVQICSIIPMGYINEDIDDDDIYDETGTIYEGKGLKDGDQIEINGIRGDIVIRVSGNAGKGTVEITKK